MFEFRPIRRNDFPLLGRWLAQPHVQRWWDDDPSPQAIEADYGGCVDGTEPSEVFIAWHSDAPVGLVQRLCLAAYPQYLEELALVLAIPGGAWSIDYLVGDAAATGRGLGTEMVRAFTLALWREVPQAAVIVVPVHAHNVASWRVLERAGYLRAASGLLAPDNPTDNRDHHIYRLDRPRSTQDQAASGASAPR